MKEVSEVEVQESREPAFEVLHTAVARRWHVRSSRVQRDLGHGRNARRNLVNPLSGLSRKKR